MADDDSEMITEFLLVTCLQQPSRHDVRAAVACGMAASRHPSDDREVHSILLITGSTAELYIQPMLSCVGDIDIMFYHNNMLAIPQDCPPPTCLPAEFHNSVKVCEIIGSKLFPGYVYLKLRYLLTESTDDGTFQAEHVNRRAYAKYVQPIYANAELHGPAQTIRGESETSSVDNVACVRCLLWPIQASDWPRRHRNYGWPDSATVDCVVSNGCDVVHVAHSLCKRHEWLGKHQSRLSFSRAEIVLINSWIPVQQIMYHMLRIFVKTDELITSVKEDSGTKTLNNYHIKTLMLWACEQQPTSVWMSDVNVVRICAKLLHTLSAWLTRARIPHYFINNYNLLDSIFSLEIISSHLMSQTESWLSTWFINNYIRKCSSLCPNHVSQLFNDISTRIKLHHAVTMVVNWRLDNVIRDLSRVFNSAMWQVVQYLEQSQHSVTARSCACLKKELSKIDSHLSVYFTAVIFLHVAYKIPKQGFNGELMDILATILEQYVGRRRYSTLRSRVLSLRKAATLMKVVANSSRSTVQLVEIELSKAYLFSTLRSKDCDSKSVYCLANVYLAVLYYTTGQYQAAIDHCTVVTRSQDHSQCNSHAVQGELLPKIDDNTDSVLGLVVFYQYLRTAALKQQLEYSGTVLTTEMFAHYLHIKVLSQFVTNCRFFTLTLPPDEFGRYSNYIKDLQHSLHIADILLFKRVSVPFEGNYRYKPVTSQRRKPTNTTERNTSELVELLQQCAVEHLTVFQQLAAQQFQSALTVVTTDVKALYAYKRGDYQCCLQLSTENVCKLLETERIGVISTHSEFVQLLDDDIVSLIALTVILNPTCRHKQSYYSSINQLTLSLYLMSQCQLKLQQSPAQLIKTLNYVEVGRKTCPTRRTFNHMTLKLIKRKLLCHLFAIS